MIVSINQIVDTRNTSYAFKQWEDGMETKINMEDYATVYTFIYRPKPPVGGDSYDIDEAAIETDVLGVVQDKFVTNLPNGFRGHSIATSDIVTISGDTKEYYYKSGKEWINITNIV